MPTLARLPKTMQALELQAYSGPSALHLVERPMPQPGPGEVLIKMAAAPINPSDLLFLHGRYGLRKQLPVIPGFEGSGTVVACGSGMTGRALLGRRVACGAPQGDGTWAEYLITGANVCLPLLPHIGMNAGATMIVNPLSAWALIDIARRERHRAIAQTAAASQLGRMLVRLAQRENIPLVNIVRRPEQETLLRHLGATHILNSSTPDFADQLKSTFRDLEVTLAFDAVGGVLTGQLLHAMPRSSRITVYGALASEACQISAEDLVFGDKRVDGFWLTDWLGSRSVAQLFPTALRIQQLLMSDLQTTVRARYRLEDAQLALAQYTSQMTEGKILFTPEATS
jgi:NADPH:quinone reductase-like Zn-dependent oxidoreductase